MANFAIISLLYSKTIRSRRCLTVCASGMRADVDYTQSIEQAEGQKKLPVGVVNPAAGCVSNLLCLDDGPYKLIYPASKGSVKIFIAVRFDVLEDLVQCLGVILR